MGRDYAKLSISIWQSRKFKALRSSDRARLLYFYFHTCRQVTSCGCFNCPVGYVVADLMWGENQILEAIDSLSEARLIDWNANEEVVRIVGFLDHDPPTNPKHASAVIRVALEVPDCQEKCANLKDLLKNEHCEGDTRLRAEYDRLCKAFREPIETPCPLSPVLTPIPSSLRSEERGKAAPRRKMPDSWPTGKDREAALAYWKAAGREDLAPTIEAEVVKARAHHLGKGTRSPDWSQVWVTWYANTLGFSRTPKPSPFPIAKIIQVA